MKEWRCFFCDNVFTDEEKAREHFQRDRNDKPECIRQWARSQRKATQMWSYKSYEVLGWHIEDHKYSFKSGPQVFFTGELDYDGPAMVRETYDHGMLVGVCVQMLFHDIQICAVWVDGYAEPCVDLTRRVLDRALSRERG